MMETKNLVGMILAIMISTMVVGSILAPTVDKMRVTAGDEITKSNEFGNYLYSDYSETDLTITITYDADNGNSFTVNDETYADYVGQTVLIADNFSISLAPSTSASGAGGYYTITYTDDVPTARVYQSIQNTLVVEYSHENGTITYTYGTAEPVTIETSTIMAISENGNYIFVPSNSVTGVYATSEYIASGEMGSFVYTGGVTVGSTSLICRIFVSAGEVYPFLFDKSTGTYVSDNYTVTFTIEGLTIADGTTDIYTGGQPTITVTNNDTQETGVINSGISGIVVKEVSGHATSGAVYDILGVVTIIVVLAILMVAVRFVTSRD